MWHNFLIFTVFLHGHTEVKMLLKFRLKSLVYPSGILHNFLSGWHLHKMTLMLRVLICQACGGQHVTNRTSVVTEAISLGGEERVCRNCFKREAAYRRIHILGIFFNPCVDVIESVFCYCEDYATGCWHLCLHACLSSLTFLQQFFSVFVSPDILS